MAINSNLALKTSPANNSSISANVQKTSTQQANTANSNKTSQPSVSPSTSKPSSTVSPVSSQQTTSKPAQTSQSNISNNTTYSNSGKTVQNSQPASVNIVSNSNNSAIKVNTSNTQNTHTASTSSNQTLLMNGSKGEEVKQLQQALVNAGYNIKVDGIYGKQTEAAVKEYQQKNGLKVDGLAGNQTKGSLGLISNTSTSSNAPAKAAAPTSQTVPANTSSSSASKPTVQNTSASVSAKQSTQHNTPTSNTSANAGTVKQNTAPVNNNTNIAEPITSPQNNPVYSQPKTISNYQQTAQTNVQASKTQPEVVSKAQEAISKSSTVNEQSKTVDNKAAGVYNDVKGAGGSKANDGKVYGKISANVPVQAIKGNKPSILDNILDKVQFGLDLGGLIPGIGEPLDLVNAGIYLLRKDYLNAGLSASSVIPLVGVAGTVGKYINKGVKAVDKIDDVYDAAKAVKKADDIYDAARGTFNSSKSLLQAGNKADALKSIESLPTEVQSSVKSFFKGASNAYTDFTVEKAANGNYMVKMTKPGNVPGSKAVYYKEIGADGSTIKVYKDTFDPTGNLVHTKHK